MLFVGKHKFGTWLVAAITLAHSIANEALAKQTEFSKQIVNNQIEYQYQWLDQQGKEQQFSFLLDKHKVYNDYRHFKALTPARLQMYSLKKLKQAAAQVNPREGRVAIKQTSTGVEFELSSTDEKWIEQQSQSLHALYEQSLSDYLHQEYYIEFADFHQSGNNSLSYKPDHVRFAKESKDAVLPIARAIKEKMPRANARRVANFLLSWLQSIPYNEITSRAQSNGSGYLPPLRVVENNMGDCDSKVTLMASILKAMFPRLRIAIIYVPKHALIGLNVSHLNTDERITIDGLDYTLAEPVGPGQIKFAEIAEQSKRYIYSGIYKVELL